MPLIGIAFWWTRRISVVLGFLFVGGVLLRMVDFPPGGAGGSDVLAAVNEGIGVLLGGGLTYDVESRMYRGQALIGVEDTLDRSA